MSMFEQHWKVEMTKQELEFADFLLSKKRDQLDGNGEFIAPSRGGVVFLKDFRNYTEDQLKWLLFVEFQKYKYRIPGFVGLKLINGNWNKPIPAVNINPDAEAKYGMKRLTNDGAPVDDITGLPIYDLIREQTTHVFYEWNSDTKEYDEVESKVKYYSYLNQQEKPLQSFDLYKQKPEAGE